MQIAVHDMKYFHAALLQVKSMAARILGDGCKKNGCTLELSRKKSGMWS